MIDWSNCNWYLLQTVSKINVFSSIENHHNKKDAEDGKTEEGGKRRTGRKRRMQTATSQIWTVPLMITTTGRLHLYGIVSTVSLIVLHTWKFNKFGTAAPLFDSCMLPCTCIYALPQEWLKSLVIIVLNIWALYETSAI